MLPNCDESPTRALLLDVGWGERIVEQEVPCDNLPDPNQLVNVMGRDDISQVRDDMRARLEQLMRETGDPLLAGELPPPPGGVTNEPNGLSPGEGPKVSA